MGGMVVSRSLSSSPGAVLHGLDLIRRLSLFIHSRIPSHGMAPLSVGLPSQSSLETSLQTCLVPVSKVSIMYVLVFFLLL